MRFFLADYSGCFFWGYEKILNIRFEDFVLSHKITAKKILDFLEISENCKSHSPNYRVENSVKNVQRWKTYPNQKVMDKIASELKDFLYVS